MILIWITTSKCTSNLRSAASSVSTRILNLIPAENEWSMLLENLRRGIMNSDELALQEAFEAYKRWDYNWEHGPSYSLITKLYLNIKEFIRWTNHNRDHSRSNWHITDHENISLHLKWLKQKYWATCQRIEWIVLHLMMWYNKVFSF